jgi:hypothetical protein
MKNKIIKDVRMNFKSSPLLFRITFSLLLTIIIAEVVIDCAFGDGDWLISTPIIYYPLSLIKSIFVLLVLFNNKKGKELCIKLFNHSLFTRKANALILSLFRISYSLILLIIALQVKQYLVMRFSIEYEYLGLIKVGWYLWIFSLVMMLLGVGGRVFYIISFLCIPYYLDGTVGTQLSRIAGFWLIFMGTTNIKELTLSSKFKFFKKINKYAPPSLFWPVYLMGLNMVMIVSTAGLSKLLDPFWLNGTGFYYSFMQPWLKYSFMSPLLNYEAIMIAMSYLTIVSEIFVVLFLIKKTRLLGYGLIVSMYLLLTFVLRIDPIGPMGLCISFGLLSIVPEIATKFNYSSKNDIEKRNSENYSINLLYKVVGIYCVFMMIVICFNTIPLTPSFYQYPKIVRPYYLVDSKEYNVDEEVENANKTKVINYFNSFLTTIPKPYLGGFYAPFNFHHFLGRIFYKIDLKDNKGEYIDIFDADIIFNEDGTTNFFGPSGFILRPRVLQNRMWALQEIYYKLCKDNNEASLSLNNIELIKSLSVFYKEKYKTMSEIDIYIKVIEVPYSFQGNLKKWESKNWTKLLTYNIESFEIKVNPKLEKIELNLSLFDELSDYDIKLNYVD